MSRRSVSVDQAPAQYERPDCRPAPRTYRIDSTSFSDGIPILPRWTRVRTIVQTEAFRFASRSFPPSRRYSANVIEPYHLTGRRGLDRERYQSLQRELDGIVAWYFHHVAQSLNHLCCGLHSYFWVLSSIPFATRTP